MLESMFHATLHTLAQTHGYDIVVHSVSPRKVTRLWLADVEEKLNVRETKLAKIACAERILRGECEESAVDIVGEARSIADGFNRGKRGDVRKFDDLADSMLQGLGWWKWHVNRLKMVDEIQSWAEVQKSGKTKPTKTRRRKVEESDVSLEEEVEIEIEIKNSTSEAKKSRGRKKLELHA